MTAVTLAALVARVADQTHVPVKEIRGPSRVRPTFMARALFCAAACRAGFAYSRIGRFLGGRDHSTIIAAVRRAPAAVAYFAGAK